MVGRLSRGLGSVESQGVHQLADIGRFRVAVSHQIARQLQTGAENNFRMRGPQIWLIGCVSSK